MCGLREMVSLQRISNLPIVKTGLYKASDIYIKVKKSNRFIEWSLGTAEATVTVAIDLSKPTIVLFNGPIHLIDEILCKSLDMVEDAVPIIKSEPEYIFRATKEYVTSVMEPVLKRADSVKEISIKNAITYRNIAAESVDNALSIADVYVNKYLPEIPADPVSDAISTQVSASPEPQNPTERTIKHVNKFSRTLKRRLTQRTIYEARELRKQGVNLVHVLVHFTDLLARDPKAFAQKMKELWNYLSKDEPENQAPPQSLEQLIVMLTREGARRFVHVTNFSVKTIVNIPQNAKQYFNYAMHKYSEYIEKLELNSQGIRRQAEILKNVIYDIIDKFVSLIIHPSRNKKELKVLSNKAIKQGINEEENANTSVKNSSNDTSKPSTPNISPSKNAESNENSAGNSEAFTN